MVGVGKGEPVPNETMRHPWRFIVVALWALYTFLTIVMVAGPPLGLPVARALMPLATLSFFTFSLTHASWRLGGRHALLLLGLTFGVSLTFESVGVLTGWIYGPYHYTDRLGPKVFGLVPFLIPIAWFMMSYCALVLAETLTGIRGVNSVGQAAGMAFLSAMIMTAWDLGMDPVMVTTLHWVWEAEGAYFGIPVQNYLGWLATTFCIYFPYRLIVARHQPRPWGAGGRGFESLPTLAYVVTWLSTAMVNLQMGQAGVALVTFFGMGSFALLGLMASLWNLHPGSSSA